MSGPAATPSLLAKRSAETPELLALRQSWGAVARHLLAGGLPLLMSAWNESQALSLIDGTLVLEVPQKRLAILQDEAQQSFLASAIASIIHQRPRLVLRTQGSTDDAPTDDRSRRYRTAEAHPLVQDLMKRFQAELTGRELVDLETWMNGLLANQGKPAAPSPALLPEGD